MKFILISVTHGQNNLLKNLPAGDIVIHCGDATKYGSRRELADFAKQFSRCRTQYKILIAGNHDGCFQRHPEEARQIVANQGIIYLEDSYIIIGGYKFWGMPWTAIFQSWYFMADASELATKWFAIPRDVNVLISHGPPKYIRDLTNGEHAGCLAHSDYTTTSDILKLNVFGHIHEGYGYTRFGETDYINCSLLNGYYQPINLPIIYELG